MLRTGIHTSGDGTVKGHRASQLQLQACFRQRMMYLRYRNLAFLSLFLSPLSLSIYLSTYLSICLSTYLSGRPICGSVHPSISLSLYHIFETTSSINHNLKKYKNTNPGSRLAKLQTLRQYSMNFVFLKNTKNKNVAHSFHFLSICLFILQELSLWSELASIKYAFPTGVRSNAA